MAIKNCQGRDEVKSSLSLKLTLHLFINRWKQVERCVNNFCTMQIECIVVVISAITATRLFVDAQIGRFQESYNFFFWPIITHLEQGTCSRFFPRKESATCVSLVLCLVQLVLFAPVEIVIGQRENLDQRQEIIRGFVTCVWRYCELDLGN